MGREKEEIRFHIMHSMKGGCGKSTCSLFKALQLAHKGVDGQARVLLLDADLRGSAWQPLLFRDDAVAKNESCQAVLENFNLSGSASAGKGFTHTIAIPDGYQQRDNLSRFVQDMDFPLERLVQKTLSYAVQPDPASPNVTYAINGYLDFILAGAESSDKAALSQQNHTGKLAPGIYINRLGNLLNYVLRVNATEAPDNDRKRRYNGQYKDIVIDMPPGYDGYSDIVLDLLRRLAAEEDRIKLHYYQVTTEDIGHMALALKNIEKTCELKTDAKEFSTVNAILNIPFSNASPHDAAYETRMKRNISDLREALGARGKVYRNDYNSSFHEYSTITERQEFILEDGRTLEEQEETPWEN